MGALRVNGEVVLLLPCDAGGRETAHARAAVNAGGASGIELPDPMTRPGDAGDPRTPDRDDR
jgi:hypothetical protein